MTQTPEVNQAPDLFYCELFLVFGEEGRCSSQCKNCIAVLEGIKGNSEGQIEMDFGAEDRISI